MSELAHDFRSGTRFDDSQGGEGYAVCTPPPMRGGCAVGLLCVIAG